MDHTSEHGYGWDYEGQPYQPQEAYPPLLPPPPRRVCTIADAEMRATYREVDMETGAVLTGPLPHTMRCSSNFEGRVGYGPAMHRAFSSHASAFLGDGGLGATQGRVVPLQRWERPDPSEHAQGHSSSQHPLVQPTVVSRQRLVSSRTLLVMAPQRFPAITLDDVLGYLASADPPAPPVLHYSWPPAPKSTKGGGIGFLEFATPQERLQAHFTLSGQLHHTRLIVTIPSESGEGLSGSDGATAPQPAATAPFRLRIDSEPLTPEARLAKACGERGIPPVTWNILKKNYNSTMSKLGYASMGMEANGDCLYLSLETAAAAKNVALDVSQARSIGAAAWTVEQAIALRFDYQEVDNGNNPIFQWMFEHGGAQIVEDDEAFVAAYRDGVRTNPMFHGREVELQALAAHIQVNVLIVDEAMSLHAKDKKWRWCAPTWPDPPIHPHTVILRFSKCGRDYHYDVYSFDGQILLDSSNLPQVVKTLHCIR